MSENRINQITIDQFVKRVKPENGIIFVLDRDKATQSIRYRNPSDDFDEDGQRTGYKNNDFSNSASHWNRTVELARFNLARLGVPSITVSGNDLREAENIEDMPEKLVAHYDDVITRYKEILQGERDELPVCKERATYEAFAEERGINVNIVRDLIKHKPESQLAFDYEMRQNGVLVTEYSIKELSEETIPSVEALKQNELAWLQPIFDEGKALWVPDCLCCLGEEQVTTMASLFEEQKVGILTGEDHCGITNPQGHGIYNHFYVNDRNYMQHFQFTKPQMGEK